MTGKIFISYRRGDEAGFAGRLFDSLGQLLPSARLFIDVDNIDAGHDFVEVLRAEVNRCDVLLAIIGRNWIDARDDEGRRRLDDPNDFVRIEIESALSMDKLVIPILVNDAQMPRADLLPESLRPLVRRNALRLTHDRFRADAEGIARKLRSAVEKVESEQRRPISALDGQRVEAKPLASDPSVPRANSEALLSLEHVRAGYGEAVVLDDISLDLPQHGSLAVLGRNGVGKTTLIMSIMGCTQTMRGAIRWRGADITGLATHRRAKLGLGWVAQEREIFPSLSVEENLTVAERPGKWALAAIYQLFPRLKERRGNMGNQLSGGEQQMLAMARALMTNPALLLLDEPMEGLAPIIVEELAAAIKTMVAEEGMAVILIEQHAELALSLTRDAVIMERGAIVHRAASAELLRDAATLDRYIGLRIGETA
jgi:branched-chain amino acid transport system ATP-binding protein